MSDRKDPFPENPYAVNPSLHDPTLHGRGLPPEDFIVWMRIMYGGFGGDAQRRPRPRSTSLLDISDD